MEAARKSPLCTDISGQGIDKKSHKCSYFPRKSANYKGFLSFLVRAERAVVISSTLLFLAAVFPSFLALQLVLYAGKG